MTETINTAGAYRNVREARDLIYHAYLRLIGVPTAPFRLANELLGLVSELDVWLDRPTDEDLSALGPRKETT